MYFVFRELILRKQQAETSFNNPVQSIKQSCSDLAQSRVKVGGTVKKERFG